MALARTAKGGPSRLPARSIRLLVPPRSVHPQALLGPDSTSARLLTRPGILLGGPRALLMQVAAPGVAAGVTEHSYYREHMFERLVRTLAVVANVAFASPARRGEVLGLLAKTHEKVRGRTPGGAPYSAGDADLVTWVHATLIDSAMAVNRRWLAELDPSETEDFYSESLRLGSAFGVPEGALPDQLSRFEEWMAENVTLLEVGDQARDIAAHLLRPPLSQAWGPLGGAASPLAHHCLESITADLLPTPLRDAYALKTHGRTECAAWSALSRTSRSRRRITAGARPDAPTRLAARLARLGLEQG